LNSAFSFCICDEEKSGLFLARDPLGAKFLYYTNHDGRFIFSSLVESITEAPQFQREIDLGALNYFIGSRNVPDELCIFNNIKMLLPGGWLKFDLKSGNFQASRYWEPRILEPKTANEDELSEKLEGISVNSLKLRMNGEKSL
jgi:asparagine synthase (glutamine-hydrolysing)